MSLCLEPIGQVRCPLPRLRDGPWGDVVSELHFTVAVTRGLKGIEQFSHLLVLFFMHQVSDLPARDLVRRPGGRQDMPRIGIFAQRASSRPNALGVSVVPLISHKRHVLYVRGLDAFDGSPILDVKPYVADFDKARRAAEPEWMRRLMRGYF
ncbi:MAG: tRNA (N6-threonylcarbamoyladenosine(37)-N6)-methyltransferase TrmO [Myxococcaceae bacterium]